MLQLYRRGIFSLLATFLSIGIIVAQTANCPELVNEALLAVEENCLTTGRNEACYGYDQVEASFLTDVAEDFFTIPSNLTPLADLETIRTAPLNAEMGVWGVAVMNLQADLPNTIPGQTVTFILLGDVEVENAVDPETAFQPNEGIDVTVNVAAGANVRSGPGQNFNVLGGVLNGDSLSADGFSEDGEWLRVAYRNRPAWISLSVINDNDPALRDLPTLTSDLQTPMQAFFLRTGIGQPACEEAPADSLLVQGPENIEIQLTVNGADIRLGSSGIFRIVEIDGEKFLEIIVFDGHFEVGGVTIERGEHSLLCLGDESSRGLDGEGNDLVVTCDPTPPERIELGEWCVLEAVPATILNYGLDVPCPGETPVPTTGGQSAGGATPSQIAGVDCSSFSLVSPLFPVDAGNHTFSWTAVTGENITYQLVFYNYEGIEQESFYTNETSYNLNLGAQTSTGGTFYWEVRAYQNGAYACVTFRSQPIARTADADVVGNSGGGNGGGVSVSLSCAIRRGVAYANVSWSGLPTGDTITIEINTASAGSASDTSRSASGSMSINTPAPSGTSAVVRTSGGYSQSTSCS